MKKPDTLLSWKTHTGFRRSVLAAGFIALALALSLLLGQGAALAIRPVEEASQPAARPVAAALSVTKTMISPANRTTVYGGEEVVFEIVVKNTGTTTVLTLPQEDWFSTACLQFKPKASPPETSSDPSSGYITWADLTASLGPDLQPGEAFTTTVTFAVPANIPGGVQSGYNTARVAGARDETGAEVPAAESTVEFTCATPPSLALDKSFSVPQASTVLLTGQEISFTLTLTNTGPTTLSYIPLTDLFDESCLTFKPKASPPESSAADGLIEWIDLTAHYGDLPSGASFTVGLNFTVNGPYTDTVHASWNLAQTSGARDIYGALAPDAQDMVRFSCAAPASIGDYVWLDLNGNGLQDEPAGSGLNGVTVYLYLDDGDGVFEPGGDDVLVATEVTSGDGGYLFDMLHAGSYWVDVDDATVPLGLSLSTAADPMLVTVAYGEAYGDADFGYAGTDLSIVKTDAFDPVAAGGVLTYTLSVHNAGPSAALNVVVTDTLPAGLTFVAADPTQTSGPNPLTWHLGTLAAGASQTIVVTTTVNSATIGVITNRAEVGSDSPDLNPDNNTDTEPTLVIRPAIRVEKSANPTVTLPGGAVLYTYVVTNPGNVPLADVTVTDDKCAPVSGPLPAGDVNGNGLLDPGEAWVYTCSTTVSQDTINTVTVTGKPSDPNGQPYPGLDPVQDEDTAFVDVVEPAIAIEKTADPTTVYAGGSVTYTYVVTNPGDVPLVNVTVSDDKCSPVTPVTSGGFNVGDADKDGLLDPGETWQFTCTTTVSQDTLNTATTAGQPAYPNGQPLPGIGPVRDDDMAFVDVINPAIRIVKTPSAVQVLPGTVVTYNYAVSNVGDAPLTSVVVTDDKCAAVTPIPPSGNNTGDTNNNGLLDPGETWLYQCSAALNHDTTNTATVTAVDPLGGPVTDDDVAFVDVLMPGLQVVKGASATVVYAGTTVLYTYTVINTGSDPVYDVVVSDDKCSPVTYQGGDVNNNGRLEPTETWTYTCSAALNVDTVNIATVTGQDALGNPVTPDDGSAAVNVINPAIRVVKTADPTVILAGGTVVYTYVVTNPGDDPLSNVAVSDDKCSPVAPVLSGGFNVGDLNQDGLLDPNEAWRFTCTANPAADTTNTAAATGDDSLGKPVRDTDTAFVDVVRPAIRVEKTATPPVTLAGGLVLYTYAVTNPGDVPLANVTVTDDKCSPVLYQSGDTDGNGLLDVNETWTYTCVTAVSVDTTNVATAVGQPANPNGVPLPGIGPVQDQDTAFVDVVAPAIHLEKTANPITVYVGGSVTYTYAVTNPGDVPLAGVTVSDDKCSPVTEVTSGEFNVGDTNQNGLLDPGESWRYTCTTTLSQDTLNTAVAIGQPAGPNGQPLPGIGPVRDDDTAFVDVLRPAIRIVKTPGVTMVLPGTTVTYSYAVSNIGDAPLTNVAVTDDKCSPVKPIPPAGNNVGDVNNNGVLDPGETWVYTCNATLTEDTVNVVQVTATDPVGNPVTDDDRAFVDVLITGLQIDKAANPLVGYPGQPLLYTYTVRNTGSDPVYNVQVSDDKCSPVTYISGDGPAIAALEPGEIWVFACATVFTGDITNIATVTGEDALGTPRQDQASATVDTIKPAIHVEKTANPAVILPGGQVVYTYVVTNPGDDPLSKVSVSDDKCSPVTPVLSGSFNVGDLDQDGMLDPGETWRFTCTANPTEDTTNTATATGDDSLGKPVRDTDTAFVDVVRPAINVEKSASPVVVLPGGVVVYTYAVTNPGDVPLGNVALADNKCVPVLYQGGDANNNGLLDTSETWTYGCTTTVSMDTTNTVTSVGQPTDPNGFPLPGIPSVSDQDTAFVDVVNPRINVVKTADPTVVQSGGSVTYTYVVTNPGDVPLAPVTVSDDKCGPVTPVMDGTFNVGDSNQNGLLDPGERWQYTCTTTLTVDTLNTAVATGQPTDPQGQPLPGIPIVQDDDTAFVDVINPAIDIQKTPDTQQVQAGGTVTFTITVTNTGDVPLTNVTVSDVNAPDCDRTIGSLAVGATYSYTCTAMGMTADFMNIVKVTGTPPAGPDVTDDDDAAVDVIRPAIDIEKTPDAQQVAYNGTAIFVIWVKNTGDVPLTNIVVSDPLVPDCDRTFASLAVGEVQTYNCVRPNVTAGFTNVATATGTPPVGPDVTDSDSAVVAVEPPTSVQVLGFQATVEPAGIALTWQANVPVGTAVPGFDVYRRVAGAGDWEKLTSGGPVVPETLSGDYLEYRFNDTSAVRGLTYEYQLMGDTAIYGPWQVVVPGKIYQVFLPLLSR